MLSGFFPSFGLVVLGSSRVWRSTCCLGSARVLPVVLGSARVWSSCVGLLPESGLFTPFRSGGPPYPSSCPSGPFWLFLGPLHVLSVGFFFGFLVFLAGFTGGFFGFWSHGYHNIRRIMVAAPPPALEACKTLSTAPYGFAVGFLFERGTKRLSPRSPPPP